MAPVSWQTFEKDVREIARLKWGAEPRTKEIAGIKFDCVLELAWDHWVIIEITQNTLLEKVRGDIQRVGIARQKKFNDDNVYVECFVILSELPTTGMLETGASLKVKVMNDRVFQRLFFDKNIYVEMRTKSQFGSAVHHDGRT